MNKVKPGDRVMFYCSYTDVQDIGWVYQVYEDGMVGVEDMSQVAYLLTLDGTTDDWIEPYPEPKKGKKA